MNSTQNKTKPYGFWNWGTGITIVIITGALGMLFLVYLTTKANFEMVTNDYYAEELNYDRKMKANALATNLSAPVSINKQNEFIIIAMPQECAGKNIKGTLLLYCPSNAAYDIQLPLQFSAEGIMAIPLTKINNGSYKAILNWEMEGKQYNSEQTILIKN